MSTKPTTKTFGKSTREVPAAADKAKKWYNADDETDPKKVSLHSMPPSLLSSIGWEEAFEEVTTCESIWRPLPRANFSRIGIVDAESNVCNGHKTCTEILNKLSPS